MNGESYMSIMQRGGGIVNTVHATREATPEELKCKAEWFIDVMSAWGSLQWKGKAVTDLTAIRSLSNWK